MAVGGVGDGDDYGGSSGGADDTGFGMDDDMPLVTSIPEIKRGHLPVGTMVDVHAAVVTSPVSDSADVLGMFVQDEDALSFGGLRVAVSASSPGAPIGEMVRLTGTVAQHSVHGWYLDPLQLDATDFGVALAPVRAEVADIRPQGSRREALSDMVIMVTAAEGESLRVLQNIERRPGFLVDDGVWVHLEVFGVGVDLPVGTELDSITGILQSDGNVSMILPRDTEAIVLAD